MDHLNEFGTFTACCCCVWLLYSVLAVARFIKALSHGSRSSLKMKTYGLLTTTNLFFHPLLFSSRILRCPFFAIQGETLISSNSGKRLVAGEGGEGDDSGATLPSRLGKFSKINDFGLVGSGDIKLKCNKVKGASSFSENNLVNF